MKLFPHSFIAIGLSFSCHCTAVANSSDPFTADGFFVGAKALYLAPFFDRDIVGADEKSGTDENLEILGLEWDGGGAYKVWGGYETEAGFGLSIAHMGLNQTTDFSRAEGTGQVEVDFDLDSDNADINVDGALKTDSDIRLDVTDFEVWRKIEHATMMLRYGAGLRYASFDRSVHAYETADIEFVKFDHSFKGFGPSLGYEVVVPMVNGLSLYNSGRGALLFGEHSASYKGESAADSGHSVTQAILPTVDAELGLQWHGRLGSLPGALTVRAGLEAQAYINGGGWDLYRDGAAIFPQQAGNFGFHGFSLSAQYTFGADDAVYTVEADTEAPQNFMPGFFVGAKALYLTPYFDSDIVAGDKSVGANDSLEVFSFDWHGDGAYRVWSGYETASGFGISLAHMGLNQATDFSRAEGTGELEVQFDLGADDADIRVDGTLNADNKLKLNVTDLETWQKIQHARLLLRYGAGLRYASLDRSFHATETGGDQFVKFNHRFKGFGPSLSYEAEVPIAKGFSLYNSGRGALLFGKHESRYRGQQVAFDSGFYDNYAMLPTLDAELGLQWRGKLGSLPGELTVRAGLEAQAYINGGGWDMYHEDFGALFPQHAGSFGLHGFGLNAQYKFGADDAEHIVETDTDVPAIAVPGLFAGAKALYLTPYFENDILGADENSGANNDLEILSFEWDGTGAYRVWGGYETGSGFGVSLAHMSLNHATDFSQAEGTGHLEVHFDLGADGADIFVDGTLNADTNLHLNVTDLEAWQKIEHANLMLRFGAGIRHASLERSFSASETGGTQFVNFDHSYNGIGPSLSYEVEFPVASGFSLYNSGRGALLFGKHEAQYDSELPAESGTSETYAMLPTLDAELGLQWRGMLDALPGELTVRAGFEGQAYINGGGWDMYASQAGGTFPQQAGSFGLYGFNVSAQYKFGMPED